MTNCPRCGYPLAGLMRDRSMEDGSRVICEACVEVELLELAQLGRMLPVAQWAINDAKVSHP